MSFSVPDLPSGTTQLTGPIPTLLPLLKLPCLQKPIPDSVNSPGARASMSVIWLWWWEKTHNLCLLVGFGNLVAIVRYCVAAVGIATTDVDLVCVCILRYN